MTDLYALPRAEWPYLDVLMRLALALALGLLIGLERERRGKEAGLRTFGFVALLGAMGGATGDAFALLILALVALLAVVLNVMTLRAGEGAELTTSAAMLVTCMSGILCGQGHQISPSAVMVISTALLAWKERLAGLSMGLTEGEVRSAVLLAILAIVIYPALPVGTVGPWGLIEPRATWVTVILIAGIGFVNYALWKIYGARGAEVSGFLGGLVNSNFTIIDTCDRVVAEPARPVGSAARSVVLAMAAMLLRNAGLLLILAPAALLAALPAYAGMLAASAVLVALGRLRSRGDAPAPQGMTLALPFSLSVALKYGLFFLALHVIGSLVQRQFGDLGFLTVSAIGGVMSSASAVAAAASLNDKGDVVAHVAAQGALVASFTSLAVSFVFVLRTRHRGLVRAVGVSVVVLALAGVAGWTVGRWLPTWPPDWTLPG